MRIKMQTLLNSPQIMKNLIRYNRKYINYRSGYIELPFLELFSDYNIMEEVEPESYIGRHGEYYRRGDYWHPDGTRNYIIDASNGYDTSDYRPQYSYIARGEYGNCILVVYTHWGNCFSNYSEKVVYFEYTFNHKGMLCKRTYRGILKDYYVLEGD